MLLDTNKLSLIYGFSKLTNEDDYLHDASELWRKLNDSDTIDAEYIQQWVPNLIQIVDLWEQQSLDELDTLYARLLSDSSFNDRLDAILRFLYDIQLYEMVKYFLEKNVNYYQHKKMVSSSMTGFHEACSYGFSQVCLLYIRQRQDVNITFSLLYENTKINKKEIIRNLTGLQLVCLWSKYFPKRLPSYAHTVRILLENGARVNMTSTELTTPLHWACRSQHTTQLARDLIERGASINALDKLNIQPIHYACWARNQSLIELLLANGARLTDGDEMGRTPIHFLCMPTYIEAVNDNDRRQQHEIMTSFLNNKNVTLDLRMQDIQGNTLFVYACVSENVSLMRLLLEHQPDILNISNKDGSTPLMITIDACFISGIEFLLEQSGLQRNACDTAGNTAIHHACMCVNVSMRSALLQLLLDSQSGGMFDFERQNKEQQDPLMICTMNQSIDLCQILIEHHATLTKQDEHARHCLHLACQMGNRELVSLLVNSPNIDINAIDAQNRNCMYYAISSGDLTIINQLIEHNVEIRTQDIIGDTPLHLSVQHTSNALEITRSLLRTESGRSLINVLTTDKLSPLLLAAAAKQPGVVRLLLNHGADTKVVDGECNTALHLACKSGCTKSVFYLVELGGLNVNELNIYRQTPLFYAFINNDLDLAQYLIACGARITERDNQGYLPLHMGIILSTNDREYDTGLIDLYKGEKDKVLINDQNNESNMTPLALACMQGKLGVVKHLIDEYKVNIFSSCSHGHSPLHYVCTAQTSQFLDFVQFLSDHGCTYEHIDKPKGSFLFTIIQHGHRQAAMYFIDQWLKTKPDINETHYGATVLDLLYERAKLHHYDIDTEHLINLFEKGAHFSSSNICTYPCLLINDCPLFYLTLLEHQCPSICEKHIFILHLLNSITQWPDNTFSLYKKNQYPMSVCDYFLRIVQLAHYYYSIGRLFTIIDRYFFPQIDSEQSSEQTQVLRKQLNTLLSTPLKLSEVARKQIRNRISLPFKYNLEHLGLNAHLVNYILQCTF